MQSPKFSAENCFDRVVLHGFMLINWYCTYAKLIRTKDNKRLFRMKSYQYNMNDITTHDQPDDNEEIDESTLGLPELDNLEKSITETETEIIINKTKIFYGVLLVIGIGISWALSTQFARHVQTATDVTIPPFALMWFATSFKIFCFIPVIFMYLKYGSGPGWYTSTHSSSYVDIITPQSIKGNTPRFYTKRVTSTKHKAITEIFNAEEYDMNDDNFPYNESRTSQYGTTGSNLSASIASLNKRTLSDEYKMANANTSSHASPTKRGSVFGADKSLQMDLTPNSWKMISYYLLFYALWTGANYCYYRALDSNSATIVTALFSSNNMFIYVLSIFVLSEIFTCLRMIAVITAILGILFIALNNKNNQIELLGTILALFSSIFAAFYKVYFKKIFGDMNVINVCKFLGFIGLFNGLFMWIIILILDELNLEKLPRENINKWPWGYLIGSAICGLTFDFLINFGIAFTYPLFIALGIIIGIPFNLLIDIVINKISIGIYEMIGVLCICLGFLIIVLTDLHGKGTNASFRK